MVQTRILTCSPALSRRASPTQWPELTNDWTLYDGTLQPQHERDLTTPRSLDEYPASADPHENGKIFGNMIYRLQQKPGVTVPGLSNLVLETYARVSPSRAGNPGEYDLADLYTVMDEIAVNNPVLREAISDVWAEMDGREGAGSGDPGSGGPSGGVPPPPSAPRPPGYVDGYFKRCDLAETTVSVHQNYWQPVFGATSYDVYYRVLLGGTNYVYSFTEFGTSEETINTVDVSVRVKACNAFGCSWLSADDYVQLDLCGG